jgi:hypothetical protein
MGLFIGGSAVPKVTVARVREALGRLAARGPVRDLDEGLGDLSVDGTAFAEVNGNTTAVYPDGFVEWDEVSKYLSTTLQQPVISFHIHDGDLWMFVAYSGGDEAARFNPVPDYWDRRINEAEFSRWAGDAASMAGLFPDLQAEAIGEYFVRWTPDLLANGPTFAYPDDQAAYGNCWQLADFLRRCGFGFPELKEEPAYEPVELSPELQALVEKRSADRIRFEADQAWRAKDFPAVIELLVQLGDNLKPSEQKKLAYCRRSVAPSSPRRVPWWRFWR